MPKISHWSLLAMLFSFLVSGCTSTTLNGAWRNPDFQRPVGKVYIVGVSTQEIYRRIFEDEFGRALQPYGVTTIPSYRDLQNAQETDQELLLEKAKANGADSLLLTRLLGERTEEVVKPGYIYGYSSRPFYYAPNVYAPRPYYRNYRDYPERGYEMIYEPASIARFQVITLESSLYDAVSGELIWTAQLESVVGKSMKSMITDFSRAVTKDMSDQGVI